MTYLISIRALGKFPEIEITKEEFTELKEAKTTLSFALETEIRYCMLIKNYMEFEKEMLSLVIDDTLMEDSLYSKFITMRINLNTRIANLLTAVRTYIDQTKKQTSPQIPSFKDKFLEILSHEKKNNSNYAFMENIRNYTQHNGLPVHNIKINHKKIDREKDFLLENSIDMNSLKMMIQEDERFNSKVLAEKGDNIDLKVCIRSYIESISNIHFNVRKLINPAITKARNLIEFKQNEYKQKAESYPIEANNNIVGLTAFNNSNNKESIDLLLDWDDQRKKLIDKHKKLTNLHKLYASGVTSS